MSDGLRTVDVERIYGGPIGPKVEMVVTRDNRAFHRDGPDEWREYRTSSEDPPPAAA